MEGIFPKNIKTDEIKNKIDEIRKLEYKTWNIKQINIYMTFNNLKQLDLLMIVFIIVKLI